MKKIKALLPLILLLLMIIGNFIFMRPRAIEDLLSIRSDSTFSNCHVVIGKWEGNEYSSSVANLAEDEFIEIINILRNYSFNRNYVEKQHKSTSGFYFYLYFKYLLDNTDEWQTLSISRNGSLSINETYYEVSKDVSNWTNSVDLIYEKVSALLVEKPGK